MLQKGLSISKIIKIKPIDVNWHLLATESVPAESVAEVAERLEGLESLGFDFQSGLLAIAVLLIVSIVSEKFGSKVGIPGSIILFFLGLFSHVTGFSFEHFPLEEVHVVALSVLLFFSGLSFDRSLLKRNKLLSRSIQLAVFGTVLSMVFLTIYLRIGMGVFSSTAGILEGIPGNVFSLMAVVIIAALSVQDWNSFVFVSHKIKGFSAILTNIFKVETAISASISVAVAELAIYFWLTLNPHIDATRGHELIASIFTGIFLGAATGLLLGWLLTSLIRFLITSKAQLVLAAIAFTFLGYVITFVIVEQGGYLCALVMGVVTSNIYRSSSTEDEMEFLSESLESLNIASESILFFAIGLGLETMHFFRHLPFAFYAWLGIVLIRPIVVTLFFRSDLIPNEEKIMLSSFSPKGAISMALVVTAPEMLKETFSLEIVNFLPEESITFMSDTVCGAVLISMIVKSVFIPRLHANLRSKISLPGDEENALRLEQ